MGSAPSRRGEVIGAPQCSYRFNPCGAIIVHKYSKGTGDRPYALAIFAGISVTLAVRALFRVDTPNKIHRTPSETCTECGEHYFVTLVELMLVLIKT